MKWEDCFLSDIALIGDGAHASLKRQESGIPYITAKNLGANGIDYSKVDYISEETYNKHFKPNSNALTCPKTNDILYSIIGSIGGVYIIGNQRYGISSSVAIFRANREKILPKYLYYFLKSDFFNAQIQAIKGGVAQGFLSLSKLAMVKITYPINLSAQKKIVDILSAYDKLIENNQKQIKLLEEAAQRLYKEWFVDLRFPGWENTEIVDGVPKGWKWGTLGDIAEFKRGKTITKSQVNDGTVPVVAGGIEPAYYHDKANTKAPVITVSGSGANAGFARLYNMDIYASDCSYVDIESSSFLYFIYCFIKCNKETVDNLKKGSAQPHVYAKDINAIPILISDVEQLKYYCNAVAPFFAKIKVLQKQIEDGIASRNYLLPKLMSGELEV